MASPRWMDFTISPFERSAASRDGAAEDDPPKRNGSTPRGTRCVGLPIDGLPQLIRGEDRLGLRGLRGRNRRAEGYFCAWRDVRVPRRQYPPELLSQIAISMPPSVG